MRTTLISVVWILLGIVCLPFEQPLARWLMDGGLSGDIRAVFHRVESFGHTYGLICIAVTIYLLDPSRRRQLPRIVATFATAGLVADVIKLSVWRIRPRSFAEMSFGESTFAGSIFSPSRIDWSIVSDSAYHSLPSAHTACAVALAIELGRLYPSGRRWFLVLAALCGMNRIDGGAHYASDVCWGAALGYVVVTSMAHIDWYRVADRLEHLHTRLRTRFVGRRLAGIRHHVADVVK